MIPEDNQLDSDTNSFWGAEVDSFFQKMFRSEVSNNTARFYLIFPVPCVWVDKAGNRHSIYSIKTYVRLLKIGLAPRTSFSDLYQLIGGIGE